MNAREFNGALKTMTLLFSEVHSPTESEAVLAKIFEELMTPPEVAELRGVHVRTVQWWIKKGQIPSIKKGGTTYILRQDAVNFQERKQGNPNWVNRDPDKRQGKTGSEK